jgi:hypothetical protein
MKELFSAFGSEVFRPLVTLVVPGSIAVSTFFIGLLQQFHEFNDLVSKNHAESAFVLLLVVLVAGLIIEDIGARLETFLDWIANWRTKGSHNDEWNAYLRLAFKTEPGGRRYLRTLVVRLKFELGTAIGLVFALVGYHNLIAQLHGTARPTCFVMC